MERQTQMRLVLIAVIGAGAAARGAWGLLKAYEKLASARDELDDSLHAHTKVNSDTAEER